MWMSDACRRCPRSQTKHLSTRVHALTRTPESMDTGASGVETRTRALPWCTHKQLAGAHTPLTRLLSSPLRVRGDERRSAHRIGCRAQLLWCVADVTSACACARARPLCARGAAPVGQGRARRGVRARRSPRRPRTPLASCAPPNPRGAREGRRPWARAEPAAGSAHGGRLAGRARRSPLVRPRTPAVRVSVRQRAQRSMERAAGLEHGAQATARPRLAHSTVASGALGSEHRERRTHLRRSWRTTWTATELKWTRRTRTAEGRGRGGFLTGKDSLLTGVPAALFIPLSFCTYLTLTGRAVSARRAQGLGGGVGPSPSCARCRGVRGQ